MKKRECKNCGKELTKNVNPPQKYCDMKCMRERQQKNKCQSHPQCSHNTNGRDLDKPCSISFPSPTGWERELYEKWKAEHPDVMHADKATNSAILATSHEWYVRNYVETRLLPYLAHRAAALEEKVGEIRDEIARDTTDLCSNSILFKDMVVRRFDAVISLITNQKNV